MSNESPFKNHEKLVLYWCENKPDSNSTLYYQQLVDSSDWIRNYFASLESSKQFNNTILKKLDLNSIKKGNQIITYNTIVDVTKIIGHIGHFKLLDIPNCTWLTRTMDNL